MKTLIVLSVCAFVALVWLVLALLVALRRDRKSPDTDPEKRFVIASAVFAIVWSVAFLPSFRAGNVAAAQSVAAEEATPCYEVKLGMTEDEVEALLGEPDERKPIEELRGPKSELWRYNASRCGVHFVAGKAEFVD